MECNICSKSINDDKLFTSKCGHSFHRICIHKWTIYRNNKCPTCQKDINCLDSDYIVVNKDTESILQKFGHYTLFVN